MSRETEGVRAGDHESTVKELQLKSQRALERERARERDKPKERVLSQEQSMCDYLLCVLIENCLCILYLVKIV